jgi:hypothetical protein
MPSPKFIKEKLMVLILLIFFNFPFGGRILSIVPPTMFCPYVVIFIGPPKPGFFAVLPNSKIYAHASIRKGAWVLGTALPLDICFIPPSKPIMMMGTSI